MVPAAKTGGSGAIRPAWEGGLMGPGGPWVKVGARAREGGRGKGQGEGGKIGGNAKSPWGAIK